MKKLSLGVLSALLLPACMSTPSAANNLTTLSEPALIISITSRGNGFDRVAHKEVQRLLNEAETNGVIDKILNYRKGKEGGFSACVVANSSATDSSAFAALVSNLKAVSVDNYTTVYKLTPSQHCTLQ